MLGFQRRMLGQGWALLPLRVMIGCDGAGSENSGSGGGGENAGLVDDDSTTCSWHVLAAAPGSELLNEFGRLRPVLEYAPLGLIAIDPARAVVVTAAVFTVSSKSCCFFP